MSPLTAPQNYNRQIGVQDALKVHIGKIVAGLMNRKYVIVLKNPLFHTKIWMLQNERSHEYFNFRQLLKTFQVFCNICALPGHLPCVHQTNDFRQRKLVIETFGWLAFKEWFREPEFWSWWNCSGFTNVPLYKLMQHRPHVASPSDLQEITE